MEDDSAQYQNDATAVHFRFSFWNSEDYCASFNINYARPHVFALEAEPEIASFVEHFGLSIDDPQTHGMGSGPYSREGFLRGWNAGNGFAVKAFSERANFRAGKVLLPKHIIEQVWRWNFGSKALQAELSQDIFVPRVLYINQNGNILTAITWVGKASIMPAVDIVLIGREPPQPWFKRILGSTKKSGGLYETTVVPFNDVAKRLSDYEQRVLNGLTCLVPKTVAESKEIAAWIKKLPLNSPDLKVISPDDLLHEELFSEYSKSGGS